MSYGNKKRKPQDQFVDRNSSLGDRRLALKKHLKNCYDSKMLDLGLSENDGLSVMIELGIQAEKRRDGLALS